MKEAIRFESYKEEYSELLAKFWVETADNWPNGLDEVPYTMAKDVEKKINNTNYLKIKLAFINSKIVGYCDLLPSPVHNEVCYIDILNVHPSLQGKGIGKELLRRMISYATERGYNRIDAFTWPGNLKGIYLYKRLGFFWVPYTEVQMSNYIPEIINSGIFKKNILKNLDFITQQPREHGPDEFYHKGREYYPYNFLIENQFYEIWIDKVSEKVFHFKSKGIIFSLKDNKAIFFETEEKKIKGEIKGGEIDKFVLVVNNKEIPMEISHFPVDLRNFIQGECFFKIKAEVCFMGKNMIFGSGFKNTHPIQFLEDSLFITRKDVLFINTSHIRTSYCNVYIDDVFYDSLSTEFLKEGIFNVKIGEIFRKLSSGIYKINFNFMFSKSQKIASKEKYLLIESDEKIIWKDTEERVFIWLKNCCFYFSKKGAKLAIHAHNLLKRGIIYTAYDELKEYASQSAI